MQQIQKYLALDKATSIFVFNVSVISQTIKSNLCKIVKTAKQTYYKNVIGTLDY